MPCSGIGGDRIVVGAVTAVAVIAVIIVVDGLEVQGIAIRVTLVFLSLAVGDTIRSPAALRAAAHDRAHDLRATLNLLRDQNDVVPTAPAFGLDALPGLVGARPSIRDWTS